jgi:hypothetical protein
MGSSDCSKLFSIMNTQIVRENFALYLGKKLRREMQKIAAL